MKTVIEMARESWLDTYGLGKDHISFVEALERFAALVIANHPPQSYMTWQEGYEAGKQAEREACAKVCDDMEEKAEGTECCKWPTPNDCAAAIRAWSNP